MSEDLDKTQIAELLNRVAKLETIMSGQLMNEVEQKHIETSSSHDQHESPKVDIKDEDDELHTERTAPVKVSSKAYMKMAIHAKKYANKKIKPHDWVEVIGLLSGELKNENTPLEHILVEDYWPIGHGDAVSVSIVETRYFTEIISKLPKNHYIVGWAHSHPSYGNFLSTDDYGTQSRYQALWSKSIAIVIDPTTISSHDLGFNVFRNINDPKLQPGYTEITSEVIGMDSTAAHQILKLVEPLYEQSNMSVDEMLERM